MKYLKTMAYIVGHNPRNGYNFNPIILFNCNFSINFINTDCNQVQQWKYMCKVNRYK